MISQPNFLLSTDLPSPLLASPSLYEMAALTSELDTAVITSKVKEILLQHNVGQKVRKVNVTIFQPCRGRKPTLIRFFIEMLTLRA